MRVDMKKAFAQSLAKLKVQKVFQKNKKKKAKKQKQKQKTITYMMKFQEFRKLM